MKSIDHYISLNPNFRPWMLERIIPDFVEECANRDLSELSPELIELISRGLPDEDDKKILWSFFQKLSAKLVK